jgi:hypothetical protein
MDFYKPLQFCQVNGVGNLCTTEECQNVRHATTILSKNITRRAMKLEYYKSFFLTWALCKTEKWHPYCKRCRLPMQQMSMCYASMTNAKACDDDNLFPERTERLPLLADGCTVHTLSSPVWLHRLTTKRKKRKNIAMNIRREHHYLELISNVNTICETAYTIHGKCNL